MSKEKPDTSNKQKVIELSLPSGKLPKFSEMTTLQYQEFLRELPLKEEAIERLVQIFEDRKQNLDS